MAIVIFLYDWVSKLDHRENHSADLLLSQKYYQNDEVSDGINTFTWTWNFENQCGLIGRETSHSIGRLDDSSQIKLSSVYSAARTPPQLQSWSRINVCYTASGPRGMTFSTTVNTALPELNGTKSIKTAGNNNRCWTKSIYFQFCLSSFLESFCNVWLCFLPFLWITEHPFLSAAVCIQLNPTYSLVLHSEQKVSVCYYINCN